MTIQNIGENCTTAAVRAWDMADIAGFRITKNSGFEPGAQGVALSKLANHRKGNLLVDCTFSEPKTAEEFESSLLGGPFGISLLRHASRLTFGADRAAPSEKLNENLTRFYRARGGLLGRGQSCALVCVDPVFRIPAKLKALARHEDREFPIDQTGFRKLLESMGDLLGFSRFMRSATEFPLNSFIFESFVNSQEHGQSTTNNVARQGVRALFMEKVVVSKTTKHDQLSEELRGYIDRSTEAAKDKLGLGLVCVTIADQGDGIQWTLPPDAPGESPASRFERAFLPGVTRKPQGEVKRGLGLSHALSAAHRMRARIEIHSSGVRFLQDFSLEEFPYPKLDPRGITQDSSIDGCGTTISIWVPEFDDLDQPDLFERKNLLRVEPTPKNSAA